MENRNGSFTVSLDFELYWGVRDKRSAEAYRRNLEGVWDVVPKMLALFETYGIHASWATVGFLMLEDTAEFDANRPEILPGYTRETLCPYRYFDGVAPDARTGEKFGKIHFARPLVEAIRLCPFQEIATHTFSHYYTREPMTSLQAFEADLAQAVQVFQKKGIHVESLVFPRNQIDPECLEVLKKAGIKNYRGNPKTWAYKEGETAKTFLQRAFRFVDIYFNLSGAHGTLPHKMRGLTEVKSSMFFRAYNHRFRILERLKIRRIKNAMTAAAKRGENFHLWWHPHNFGINQKENLDNLETVLQHFDHLRTTRNMASLNMRELGALYD